jgi:hypothetical protein
MLYNQWLTHAIRMLEDPSYESIVRWGEGGESFVVLEVLNDATPPQQTLTFALE